MRTEGAMKEEQKAALTEEERALWAKVQPPSHGPACNIARQLLLALPYDRLEVARLTEEREALKAALAADLAAKYPKGVD